MNKDIEIIWVNISRGSEGLRVIEDFCRFSLRHRALFELCKGMREELRQIGELLHPASGYHMRFLDDIGKSEVNKEEYRRSSAWDLVRANAFRLQQSLRVIEEFAKMYNTVAAKQAEDLRYRAYTLHAKVLRQTPHFWLRLYFEQGIVYPLAETVEDIVWLVEHGAKIVQLRAKESRSAVTEKTERICEFIGDWNKSVGEPVLFFMNDDVELARQFPVAGVHIGQDDMDASRARELVGSHKVIGRSNGSIEELSESCQMPVDYVSIGAMFKTPTKPDKPVLGFDILEEAVGEATLPLIAIGGIHKGNVKEVYKRGIRNVSVVRAAREFFEE